MLDHRTETFMAVCNVMNYREAAELLHITQPAVTQHIQFLEKEYGCRLFLYENRKLIKTPVAQMLEDYLRSVQQRENFLREKIKNNGLRELRIGATKTIGDYVITDRIHDFLNQSDTALTLIVDNTKHLLHLLEQNTLDYAIIEGFFDKNRFGSQLYRRDNGRKLENLNELKRLSAKDILKAEIWQMISDYIRYLGNLRWTSLGYPALYPGFESEP